VRPLQSGERHGCWLSFASGRDFHAPFNPRIDGWADHFTLEGAQIVGITPVGQVTARLLRFNDDDRLLERALLQFLGDYPRPKADA